MSAGCKRGFVCLDVLWILVLLALVLVLSIRGIGLVDKRANVDRLKRELVVITVAVEKLAAEDGLDPGVKVLFSRYSPYLERRAAKRLREDGRDPFGGSYGEQVVGEDAVPDPATVEVIGALWN